MEKINEEGLITKYRPKTFDEVVGNAETVASLKAILGRDSGLPGAFLFIGNSGCGKTTFAMVLKNELGIHDRDFSYYNASNTRGIDTIRKIEELSRYKSLGKGKRMFCLDECHKLTNEAQNALLRLLEHPPTHCVFVLCTTDPQRLLGTVRQRCTDFKVSPQPARNLMVLLVRICEAEGKDVPRDILRKIAQNAEGAPRIAIKTLDKIIDLDPEDNKETIEKIILEASVESAEVIEICRMIVRGASWSDIRKHLNLIEEEPEQVRHMIMGYFNAILINNDEPSRAAQILAEFLDTVMYTGKPGLHLQIYMATLA